MIQAASQGKAGVYAIVNTVNGKRYVGSSVHLRNRRTTHWNKLKGSTHPNPYLQASVCKYGLDKFIFIILEFCKDDKEELLQVETKWLRYYSLKRLYNIREIPTSNLGIKYTEEVKAKMRTTNAMRMPVRQYHLTEDVLLKEFESVSEANRETGVDSHEIIRNCKCQQTKAGGYRWAYSSDNRIPDKATFYVRHARRVLQLCPDSLEIVKIFENGRLAAEHHKIRKSSIYGALVGRYKIIAGFKWKYE